MTTRESWNPDSSLTRLPKALELVFYPGGREEATRAMEAWATSLVEEAGGRLSLRLDHGSHPLFLPALGVEAGPGSSVYYHFVPEGPELRAFREFLWNLASLRRAPPEGPDRGMSGKPLHRLYLVVAGQCPNCPQAARIVLDLATRLPNLAVHLLEVTHHPRFAEECAVRSVPTLLVDRRVRYVGIPDGKRLTRLLEDTDPLSLTNEQIRQKILTGEVSEAAEWIARGGNPAFLAEDLGRSTFEERIALLLAFEEALEKNPRALDSLVEHLLPHLHLQNPSIRGDVADLLGKIGHPAALPALKEACQDPDPDVREAAQEAVERIKGSFLLRGDAGVAGTEGTPRKDR